MLSGTIDKFGEVKIEGANRRPKFDQHQRFHDILESSYFFKEVCA